MGFISRECAYLQSRAQRLEERVRMSTGTMMRIAYSIALAWTYILVGIAYAISILFLSPQSSFSLMTSLNPEKGYTRSYTKHRTWQKTAKVSAVSSIVVMIIVTALNGILLSNQKSFASDDAISVVSVSVNNMDPDIDAEYGISFTTTDTITASPGGLLYIYFTDESGTYDEAITPFADTTLMEGGTTISGASLSPPPGSSGETTAVRIIEDLNPGSYTITLNSVHNPPEGGTFRIALSSVSTAPAPSTLSNTFTITAPMGGGPGDEEENEDQNSENNEESVGFDVNTPAVGSGIRLNPIGSAIHAVWDAYPGADSYIIRWQTDDGAIQEVRDITEAAYTLENLTLSINVTIQIFVVINGTTQPISEPEVVTTQATAVTQQQFAKPAVPKNLRRTRQVTVNWTGEDDVSNYRIQLFKSKQKRLRTKNVSGSKTTTAMKRLEPDTTYRVRIRATYVTGDSTKYSSFVRFKTKAE